MRSTKSLFDCGSLAVAAVGAPSGTVDAYGSADQPLAQPLTVAHRSGQASDGLESTDTMT